MTSKVFAIYDDKAEAYLSPFLMQTRGQAIRAFSDSVSDPKTNFNKHPQDFSLHEIATFNDSNAEYVMYDKRVNLGTAIDFMKGTQQ